MSHLADHKGEPGEERRNREGHEDTVVLLVAFEEVGIRQRPVLLLRRFFLVFIHAGLTEICDHCFRFLDAEVGGKRRAKEFLHSVHDRTEGRGQSKAMLKSSSRHDLGRHNAAIHDRDRDKRFILADHRDQSEPGHDNERHRDEGHGERPPLINQLTEIDGGAKRKHNEENGPLAEIR